VPLDWFCAHLDHLRATHRPAVSLERVLDGTAPAPATAMTFDDGDETHFANAFPELRRRGMTATFFVVTERGGTPGYVTWPQLAEMATDGMSIQSHTATHPLLSELSEEEVARELRTSRERLDDELRQHTRTLALPGGNPPRGDAATRQRLYRNAGYDCVATTVWGPNSGSSMRDASGVLLVRRYTIRRETPHRRFEACVRAMSSATSPEGLRLAALTGMRRVVGASRYAGWRRRVLRALGK
jgi:peptidoglycan/xylan/chitin deacetylase (PgdA/CDA1 family)